MPEYKDYLEYLKHVENTTEQEIEAKVNLLNDEISNLKTSQTSLNKIKNELTDDLIHAKTQINEKDDLINIKEIELKKLSDQLISSQNLNNKIQTDFDLGKNKNNDLEKTIANLKEKITEIELERNKNQNDLEKKINQIHELNSRLESFKNEIERINSINKTLNEKISLHDTRNISDNEAKNTIQKLSNEISRLIKELDNDKTIIENLKNEQKKSFDLRNNKSEQNQISNKEKEILRDEIRKLEIKLSNRETDLSDFNDIVKNKAILVSNLEKNSREHESKIRELKRNLEKVSGQHKISIVTIIILSLLSVALLVYLITYKPKMSETLPVTYDAVKVDTVSQIKQVTNATYPSFAEDKISSYTGEESNGLPNGNGKAIYANGDTYTGTFVNGKRNGKGKYTYKVNNYYFEGEYIDNKKWTGYIYTSQGETFQSYTNGNIAK